MIVFDRVTKSYPEFTMEIDFTVEPGELVSILGPSGSGKTTTLRLIAGFEQPDSGRVLINDRDVTRRTPAQRQIGYVFQDYTLFPHMSVGRNVAYGLRVRRQPGREIDRKVRELLTLVDLPGYEERNIATLSGGEQQRIAIARALAVDPVLLLLDEPFSSIDEVLRRDLRDEIVRLQQRLGITVVFVTHSRQEALSISDRVAVMDQGRIIQYDTPEALYRRPRNRFVASFVGEANFLPGGAPPAEGALPAEGAPPAEGGLPAGGDPGAGGAPGAVSVLPVESDSPAGALLFRPEQLSILDVDQKPSEGTVVLEATIETHQFLGYTHQYGCRFEGGFLTVSDARRFPVERDVRITYKRSDGYSFS